MVKLWLVVARSEARTEGDGGGSKHANAGRWVTHLVDGSPALTSLFLQSLA